MPYTGSGRGGGGSARTGLRETWFWAKAAVNFTGLVLAIFTYAALVAVSVRALTESDAALLHDGVVAGRGSAFIGETPAQVRQLVLVVAVVATLLFAACIKWLRDLHRQVRARIEGRG